MLPGLMPQNRNQATLLNVALLIVSCVTPRNLSGQYSICYSAKTDILRLL